MRGIRTRITRPWSRLASGAMRRSVGVAVALAVHWTAADNAMALPRYTARYGQDCRLCHVNPTGGGLRNAYATQYLVPTELAGGTTKPAAGDGAGAALPVDVTVGADLRTLAWAQEGGPSMLLAMQGDVYVGLAAPGNIEIYAEMGPHEAEAFGLAYGLIPHGYLKAGRFTPDYGWRFDDHRQFSRRFLFTPDGIDDPHALLGEGVEAGYALGGLSATASMVQGGAEIGDAWVARALMRRELGAVRLGAGSSVWQRGVGAGARRAGGVFWYASSGPWTWLGEVDETRGDNRTGRLVTHEVTLDVQRGLALRAVYGFQDPDRALRSGARYRVGAGVAWFARPGLGLQAMANHWRVDRGDDVADNTHNDAELVVHFLY